MGERTLTKKIEYMLYIAKDKKFTNEDILTLETYTSEHSDNYVLGRFMGYSVSDYAFATLYWLNTEETMAKFDELFKHLKESRKKEINKLIDSKKYLDL